MSIAHVNGMHYFKIVPQPECFFSASNAAGIHAGAPIGIPIIPNIIIKEPKKNLVVNLNRCNMIFSF
jgi:hypothetical protein